VVGVVGGWQPPSRPGAAITDHHGDRHRCPDNGPRAAGCTGGSCAAPGGGGGPAPPSATTRVSGATSTGRVANSSVVGVGPISERYPLGKDARQTAIASPTPLHIGVGAANITGGNGGTNPHSKSPSAGYLHQDRLFFNERSSPASPVASLANTNRYSSSSSSGSDRYSHGSLEKYHSSSGPYARTPTPSSERLHSLDKKYYLEAVETTPQITCTLDRYTPTDRHRRNSKSDAYKIRERSTSSDRKERLQRECLQGRSQYESGGSQYERPTTPSILACPPAPAPFGGPSSSSVSEPPSPAPACDRFVAPPPADGEPETTDCYAHGTFPSPVAPAVQERFAAPPLPAPSPTEDRSNSKQRYHQDKYQYTSPNQSSERYHHTYSAGTSKSDRYQLPNESAPAPSGVGNYYQTVNGCEPRFTDGQRYVPPNAHVPVERYVPQPQPQEPFYSSYQTTYERYNKPTFTASDPYMRRDLSYHYRLPVQYGSIGHQSSYQKIRYSQMGTPSRPKCCQFDSSLATGLRANSASSSSTSSVVSSNHPTQSMQDQCQNYQNSAKAGHYQQEKGTQCPIPTLSNSSRSTMVPCRHVGCEEAVEYVGVSGGRRICATPPPRSQERCEGCIQAAAQAAAVAAQLSAAQQLSKSVVRQVQNVQMWRSSTPTNLTTSLVVSQPTHRLSPDHPSVTSQQTPRHVIRSLTPTINQRSLTPTPNLSTSSGTEQSTLSTTDEPQARLRTQSGTSFQSLPNPHYNPVSCLQTPSNTPHTPPYQPTIQSTGLSGDMIPSSNRGIATVQRAVSMPATPSDNVSRATGGPKIDEQRSEAKKVNYSQSERVPNRDRPPLHRSMSRKEMLKNYIKKETASFFGVDEENEDEEQKRWLERRKRMAYRTLGPLKDEFATLTTRQQATARSELRHKRTASEAAPSSAGITYDGQLTQGRPDILPGEYDAADGAEGYEGGLRRKDSVARMTWDGINYVVSTLTRHRPRSARPQQSSAFDRSFPPTLPRTSSVPQEQEEEAESFYRPSSSEGDTVDRLEPIRTSQFASFSGSSAPYSSASPTSFGSWRRELQDQGVVLRHAERRAIIGARRIPSSRLENIIDNSDRRQYGMGWIGKLFGRSYRKSVVSDSRIQAQLDDMDDNRPYFTYWVTTVQILVLFISIACYGFGPFGVDLQARSGQVLVTSLSLQQVDYMEPANFWGGPRAADLIHLGAKFAPCMRLDDKIMQQIEKTRKKEKETACCIRNDDSGCVQSSQADCSVRGLRPTKTISTWKKWTSGDADSGGRISGSVCGLDPKYCDAPASVHPYEWPDDITKWPICRKTNPQISNAVANRRDKSAPRDKIAEHMVCEVIGHPCCIGIHGQCRITTREYCDFVRGSFHEEASLCSQVSCLNDVCGMIPFYFPDTPDQFYRLWTSLFLHAGILQLAITILVQHFLMRDLEKLTGSLRIGIIYMGSGVAGNLASAIFVPYRADVGPAGSQFGLLACLIVEVLNAWPMLKHPNQALCKLLSITLVLFLIGLLPWVDNYAHLFGFVFGFLLSYALLPFVSFGPYDRQKKVFLIWVCLLTTMILFIVLMLLFYIIPVYDCKICSYFNCLPLTRDFCANQNINFKREEPVV
ncbi:uncharacterized protein LOC126735679, partial [Anthonomus grandis grandis]|uniref:uncharacterized protein LOC126735679 n=1 Tax=Anthonomus grandis grandis TaxID=2921223 RepID=UPI0021666979